MVIVCMMQQLERFPYLNSLGYATLKIEQRISHKQQIGKYIHT